MKIGIIGVGNITLELANRSAQSGHEVLISNPRGISTIKDLVQNMGTNVKLVQTCEAATAEIIILFVPRENLEVSLNGLPDMTGKIILHTNNPIFNVNTISCTASDQSSCSVLASLLPNSHVVKVFNPLEPMVMNHNRTKIFFTGENQKAKNNVKAFLYTLNLSGIDLSELNT
ncbi:hypothetical protein ASF10_21545 [Flavobacterium sp. Leaf82]|jgi:predicted dinucleotide-binding enzyme|uniref:NADPH-dependent F420 reductase n=1 Tax=unclassified Flavobacterium TaxID=196869 RepID=UPI00070214AF|nr:NAD(P)-binding domain-containing protein [Flavobacterium sp. Leaf82]KQO32160.1 hypothetical protein ASF10_21545 [Flavobacterium sp. Leaf82]